ncbi:MAG: glycosyltransferase family 4 protein [Patescibacteria group bacterium]
MVCRLYDPHIGGVERHVSHVSKILVKKGLEVTVLTEKFKKKLKCKETIDGIKVIRFKYPKIRFFGLFYIWFWILLHCNSLIKKIDIIHIHDVFVWYLPFRFLFPRKPVYITFHGYESYPLKKKSIFLRNIAEKLSKRSMCVGAFMKKWYGNSSDIITYGAVDLAKFKPLFIENIKYDAIFSSRLDDQTNILTYLETVKILKQNSSFDLIVLGEGKFYKQTKKIANTKGFVKDPSHYLKRSRFAFASRYLAILEAFACKKPVFAVYDNPLMKDYLRMTPFSEWIVIEKDSKKLANRVEFFLKKPNERIKNINLAFNWVKNQTWEKMVENYFQLWDIK